MGDGSASPPITLLSSVKEAAMLLNGSGEVLISARVPVLATCVPAPACRPAAPAMIADLRPEAAGRAVGQQRAGRHAHEGCSMSLMLST